MSRNSGIRVLGPWGEPQGEVKGAGEVTFVSSQVRSRLWHSTVHFNVLEHHPKPSTRGRQDCEVVNFLPCLSLCRREECSGMVLPDTGSLTGGGGSCVPSCNLDVGRRPAWQLWAVHEFTAPGVPLKVFQTTTVLEWAPGSSRCWRESLVLHSLKLCCVTLNPPSHLPLSQGSGWSPRKSSALDVSASFSISSR